MLLQSFPSLMFPGALLMRLASTQHQKTFLFNQSSKLGQKQSSRGVLRKRCSENIQKNVLENTYTGITLRHGCLPVNLLHIFRTLFYKNTYREGCFCQVNQYINQTLEKMFVLQSLNYYRGNIYYDISLNPKSYIRRYALFNLGAF